MNFYFDYFVTLDPTEIYKNLLAYLTIEIWQSMGYFSKFTI